MHIGVVDNRHIFRSFHRGVIDNCVEPHVHDGIQLTENNSPLISCRSEEKSA